MENFTSVLLNNTGNITHPLFNSIDGLFSFMRFQKSDLLLPYVSYLFYITKQSSVKQTSLIRKFFHFYNMCKNGFLTLTRKQAVRALIQRRVRYGELVGVALEGAGKQEHWATPEALAEGREPSGLVHILSPFDPLIIQRKRTHPHLRLRASLRGLCAEAQTQVRLFRAAVLVGEDIVAALDLKTDRQNRKLLVQKWNWAARASGEGRGAGWLQAAYRGSAPSL